MFLRKRFIERRKRLTASRCVEHREHDTRKPTCPGASLQMFREDVCHDSRIVAEYAASPGAQDQVPISMAGRKGEHVFRSTAEHVGNQRQLLWPVVLRRTGVGGGTGDERRQTRLLQQRAIVIADDRATGREDHGVGIEQRLHAAMKIVKRLTSKQRRIKNGTSRQRFFLCLAAVKEPAARVLGRREVQGGHRTFSIRQHPGNTLQRRLVDNLKLRRQSRRLAGQNLVTELFLRLGRKVCGCIEARAEGCGNVDGATAWSGVEASLDDLDRLLGQFQPG